MTADTTASGWGPLAYPLHESVPFGDGKAPWKDNAYLAFWDPGQDAFGVIHVSTSPNFKGRRARASVSLGGIVAEVVEELPPASYAGESISFDLAGPIEVHHPDLTLSLECRPKFALGDYGPVIPPMGGEPVKHYQQTAACEGRCVVKGREAQLTATGIRDRTWGYRDESTGIVEYVWFFISFPDFSLSAMRFLGEGGTDRLEGYLLGEDAARPISSVEVVRDASGLCAEGRFGVEGGDRMDIRARVRRGGFWVPMGWERHGPTLSSYNEFCDFRTADGLDGFGVVEHGIVRQLF